MLDYLTIFLFCFNIHYVCWICGEWFFKTLLFLISCGNLMRRYIKWTVWTYESCINLLSAGVLNQPGMLWRDWISEVRTKTVAWFCVQLIYTLIAHNLSGGIVILDSRDYCADTVMQIFFCNEISRLIF
jgi:hypothetical protein